MGKRQKVCQLSGATAVGNCKWNLKMLWYTCACRFQIRPLVRRAALLSFQIKPGWLWKYVCVCVLMPTPH